MPKKDIRGDEAPVRTGKGANNNMRRSSNEGRRRSSGGNNSSIIGTRRKDSVSGGAVKRPTMEGIFNDSDDESDGIFGDVPSGDSTDKSDSSTPRSSNYNRRRPSSRSPDLGHSPRRRGSRSEGPHSSPKRRKSHSRERRRSSSRGHDEEPSPRRARRQSARGSSGPSSLSQTQHAAKSLVAMGMGKSRSGLPRTRAGVKEQGRAREWASFCRKRTYLSLEDLPREERPRVARKGAITPFSLQLMKVCCDGVTATAVVQ